MIFHVLKLPFGDKDQPAHKQLKSTHPDAQGLLLCLNLVITACDVWLTFGTKYSWFDLRNDKIEMFHLLTSLL